ncbi:nucleotidyl transferase [Lucifera butyrica]|uniref:Nucleotidyl transferase n=1 Tax=Lucifera butyrica TaxID=1351585 RepID=A0A498REZ8_9FIRM|nr:nucleotidyltransferase family protein [Lucifera butyrica]VBB08663.1 nucleotidyl transferase [Lucifera butyrica]
MKVLILAAGKGTRLRPITDFIPKPMVPIQGKPLLEWILLQLIAQGFRDYVFAVSYFAEQIENYFADGSRWGINIQYSSGASPAGKAGEIWRARKLIGGEKYFLIVPGDTVSRLDYRELTAFHESYRSLVTVAFSTRYRLEVGLAAVNEQNLVTGFYEKANLSRPVSTGAYVLDQNILPYVERFDPERQIVDLPGDIFPVLLQEKIPIYSFVRDYEWWDIGNISEYEKMVRMPAAELSRILGLERA